MGTCQAGSIQFAPTPPRLLIVEPDLLRREALAAPLEHAGYWVSQAASSAAAVDLVHRVHPHIVLLPLPPPEPMALALLVQQGSGVSESQPTPSGRARAGEAALSTLLARGESYLVPTYPRQRLLGALAELGANGTSDRAGGAAVTHPGPTRGRGGAVALSAIDGALALTASERQVAALVVDGRTNREIAAALCLSPHTVRHHVEHIMAKLGVHRRSAIVGRLGRLALLLPALIWLRLT